MTSLLKMSITNSSHAWHDNDFLTAMPMIAGFANWIVPPQIGALIWPFAAALAFWLNPRCTTHFTGVFSGQGADTG